MILNATLPAEIRVRPTGWKSAPDSERFSLSNMSHIMPKIYVLIADVFAMPEDADNGAILENMIAGLEFALSQFPLLLGSLEMDKISGRLWVSKKKASTLGLHVKDMTSTDEFPSYNDLAKKGVCIYVQEPCFHKSPMHYLGAKH